MFENILEDLPELPPPPKRSLWDRFISSTLGFSLSYLLLFFVVIGLMTLTGWVIFSYTSAKFWESVLASLVASVIGWAIIRLGRITNSKKL